MANHKSAKKRIKQTLKRRQHNRYYVKTTRNAVKRIRQAKDKKEVVESLPKVVSMIDKLAKKGVIHKNKAARLKSRIAKKAVGL